MKLEFLSCFVLIVFMSSIFGEDYKSDPKDIFYQLTALHKMNDGELPHIAFIGQGPYLGSPYFEIVCIGTVISKYFILTTASCEKNKGWPTTVIVESTNYSVSNIFKHNKYNNKTTYDYNIALVQLTEPLNISQTLQPIELPNRIEYLDEPEWCNLTFYKYKQNTKEFTLYTMRLPVIDSKSEKCKYGRQKLLCAGTEIEYEHNTTYHSLDSEGAPLIAFGKLHGISTGNKPQEDEPYFYARVASVRQWIRLITGI